MAVIQNMLLLFVLILITNISFTYSEEEILPSAFISNDNSLENDFAPLASEHNRLPRAAVEDTTISPVVSLEGYIDGKCVFFFNRGIDATVREYVMEGDKEPKPKFNSSYTFTLPAKPSLHESNCESNKTVSLKLTYNNVNTSKGIVVVDITFVMAKSLDGNYWSLNNETKIEVEGKETFYLRRNEVTFSSGFSYSCLNSRIKSAPPTNGSLQTIELNIMKLQIQPFSTNNPKKIFADSFDCSTWFTIPLWVGLFISLLFGFIVAMGVFMLFEIKTMERFENPKGKTITVAAGE